MSRLKRKNRTDIIIKGHGSLTDAVDDVIKDIWRIDDEQYDYIAEFANDEVLNLLVTDISTLTISEKKLALILIDSLLLRYENEKNNI